MTKNEILREIDLLDQDLANPDITFLQKMATQYRRDYLTRLLGETNDEEGGGFRMYFLTMYNLSGIQKGIQAGHAAIEYSLKYGGNLDYKEFAEKHKTFIVLDGGTSADMQQHVEKLKENRVRHAYFQEPDLNNSISAIAFLVPERLYNLTVTPFGEKEARPYRCGDLEPFVGNPCMEVDAYGRPLDGLWLAWFVKQFRLASN